MLFPLASLGSYQRSSPSNASTTPAYTNRIGERAELFTVRLCQGPCEDFCVWQILPRATKGLEQNCNIFLSPGTLAETARCNYLQLEKMLMRGSALRIDKPRKIPLIVNGIRY